MLRLTTAEKLQAVLAGAVTANQPLATVCFLQDDGGASYPGGVQKTALNGVTAVDILPAPVSGSRDIDYLSILNRDTASVTLTIQYNSSANPIITVNLAPLETVQYAHGEGWSSLDASGRRKQGAIAVAGNVGDVQFNGGGILAAAGSDFNYDQAAKTLNVAKVVTSSLNQGPFAGLRNKIIGGDFSTNPWQRGTSFTGVTSAVTIYSADRWSYSTSSTAVVSISKAFLAPTVAQAGRLVTACLQISVTTADATMDAGDVSAWTQYIEGYNWAGLAQRPCVLSFWHAHSKAGTYCISLRNGGGDRSFVAEYAQKIADTWEYEAIVVPASPTAGTWNYTNGTGVSMGFSLAVGTTFQTTPGIWQTGNFLATANQVNGMDSVSNIFRFELIQLEPGAIATPFEDLPVQTVLQLCQRYFCKSYAIGTPPGTLTGVNLGELGWPAIAAGAVTSFSQRIHFPVLMRVIPTMTFFNPLVANGQVRNAGTNADCTATAVNNPIDSGFQLTCTQDAGAAANNQLRVHWTASAEF